MRESIFQLLKNNNIDLQTEYHRLYYLFEEKTYYYYYERTICSHIDSDCFEKWSYRKRCLNIEEAKIALGIDYNSMKHNLNMNKLLTYIEFIVNILQFSGAYITNNNFQSISSIIIQNIIDLLEDLNYEIKKVNEDQYIIIEKDKLSTAVAETIPNITNSVIEYRRFSLKGNIDRKRVILKDLANKVEPLVKKFKSTEFNNFVEDIEFLLNNFNIRHNNIEGKYKKQYIINIKSEDLEQWYDKTYDMILVALLIDKYIDNKSKIKELKNKLK